MKNILITGATSFIGRHLIQHILQQGEWEIYAVIRPNSLGLNKMPMDERIRIVYSDMESYKTLPGKIVEPIDAAVHLAWNGTRGAARNDDRRQKHNYDCSLDLLEAVVAMGAQVVIGAGSQAEYGPQECVLTEKSKELPVTQYGKYKLKFYQQAMKYGQSMRIRYIEPRFFSLYGEDDVPQTMVISIVANMIKDAVCDFTDCEQMWNFLHVDDAAEGIVRLINLERARGCYNFGSQDTRKLKQFILEMVEVLQSKSELRFGRIPHNDTGKIGIQPDVSRLLGTGWKPEIEFSKGILRVAEYIRTH